MLHSWGRGARNDRGSKFAKWVLEHQFQIVSRFAARSPTQDSWTCKRAFDNSCVQIDFMRLTPSSTWHDFSIATGVDHHCVHSLVELVVSKPLCQKGRRKGLRGWQPILDDAHELVSLIAYDPTPTLETIETMLHTAGLRAGHYNRDRPRFARSLESQQLRRHINGTRQTRNPANH